jgi:hypothetical protein
MPEYAAAPDLPLPRQAHRPEPIEPPSPPPNPAEPDTIPDPAPQPIEPIEPVAPPIARRSECNSDMSCALHHSPVQRIYVFVTKPAHLLPVIYLCDP